MSRAASSFEKTRQNDWKGEKTDPYFFVFYTNNKKKLQKSQNPEAVFFPTAYQFSKMTYFLTCRAINKRGMRARCSLSFYKIKRCSGCFFRSIYSSIGFRTSIQSDLSELAVICHGVSDIIFWEIF